MKIFENNKTIIGMVHLGKLSGQEGFKGGNSLLAKALSDIAKYEKGGVNAILIENWEDETQGAFISNEHQDIILNICKKISEYTKLPIGINVLPNDYKAAFYIAKHANLDFIQLDVFVDKVKTNYIHSEATPFEIDVNLEELKKIRSELDCDKIPLLTSIKPKHYTMLDQKTIEDSAKEAFKHGSDGLIITGNFTGIAPNLEELQKINNLKLGVPIIIGSGLNEQNYDKLLNFASGAIVGTAFKDDQFNNVVLEKVLKLVYLVKNKFN